MGLVRTAFVVLNSELKFRIMAEKDTTKSQKNARKEFPGAEIDAADSDRVEKGAVPAEVKRLNNNPRTADNKMP